MKRRIISAIATGLLVLTLLTSTTGVSLAGTEDNNQPSRAAVPGRPEAGVGTAFTYQGSLKVAGNPANGQYDLQFTLYDAATGGNQVGSPVTLSNQTVTQGLFTVQLDFGPTAFEGSNRWLEIAVRQAGGGNFTTLSPRQPLTAEPYAMSLEPGAVITGTVPQGGSLLSAFASGPGNGIFSQSDAGPGVHGTSGGVNEGGVVGENYSGFGVIGDGFTGVSGVGTIGDGVRGATTYGSGGSFVSAAGYGVYAQSNGSYGIYASSTAGVAGYFTSTTGSALKAEANNSDPSVNGINNGSGIGVHGQTTSGDGVQGYSATGTGVSGISGGANAGVYGASTNGRGVYGTSATSDGVYGVSFGSNNAILGENLAGGTGGRFVSNYGNGVYGQSTNGVAGYFTSTNGFGGYFLSNSSDAVQGHANGNNVSGVAGFNAGSGAGTSGVSQTGPGLNGNSGSGNGVQGNTSSGNGGNFVSFSGNGVYGQSLIGAAGYFTSTNGFGGYFVSLNSDAVQGHASGNNAAGVAGFNAGSGPGTYGTSATGSGVLGSSNGGNGVQGQSGTGRGVYGMSTSGDAVYGTSIIGTGGKFVSSNSYGVYGQSIGGAAGYFTSTYSSGVEGHANSSAAGVAGLNSSSGAGVYGSSTSGNGGYFTSQTGDAVQGHANSNGANGVAGFNFGSGAGTYGSSNIGPGVSGVSGAGDAVTGVSTYGNGGNFTTSDASHYAVTGVQNATNGTAISGTANSAGSTGVVGTGGSDGVRGLGQNAGVYGRGTSTNGATVSIYGDAPLNPCASCYAGYFNGNVDVNGTLTANTKNFKIDDPLDPANKYLYHTSVESPDMLDIYRGHVTLDSQGTAWVTMPDYFQALNTDFDYQLTAIGAAQPNLYVAQEIKDNTFKIAGGVVGAKVSWQVTGVRHDPYALANPSPVEVQKPAEEKGLYQHPELYSQPASKGIGTVYEHGTNQQPDGTGNK